MGKYEFDDYLTVNCKKSDKRKLQAIYVIWKRKNNINISFNAFINCVLFPEFFKKIRKDEKREIAERNVRIQKKYEQLLQLRKERDAKYGKR
jgi:hypothetical protein